MIAAGPTTRPRESLGALVEWWLRVLEGWVKGVKNKVLLGEDIFGCFGWVGFGFGWVWVWLAVEGIYIICFFFF